ncbi:MAG: hypothetical protein MI723_06415, partial [Caulobacterales bacterium]|nr:hypothetical protein [Caulobacterales bacterium]
FADVQGASDSAASTLALADVFLAVAPWWAVLLLAGLAAQGAMLRALVRDHVGGWVAGLQMGLDELRLFVTNVAVYVVVSSISLIIGAAGVAVFARALAGLGDTAVTFGVVVTVLIASLLALFVAVRLSPAAAATIGERRIVVLSAWSVSRECFWSLAASYGVFALVAALVLAALSGVAALAGQAFGTPFSVAALTGGEADSLEALFGGAPVRVYLGVASVCHLCMAAAQIGVGAYTFRMGGRGAGFASAVEPV